MKKEELKEKPINKGLLFPQIRFSLMASIGSFICGSIYGWTATALTKLDQDFQMSPTEYSLTVSVVSYGALFTSLIAGKVMDMLGRKKTLMLAAPLAAAGWIVCAVAKSIVLIYFGRFLEGAATGFLFACCPMYTSEICQAHLRGRLNCCSSLFITFGIVSSYVVGGFFPWRTSCWIFAGPAVAYFFTVAISPESPYWLLLQGDYKSAENSLKILRGPQYDVSTEMKYMNKKIQDVGSNISYLELFKGRTLVPLGIACFVQTAQQFTGAAVVMVFTSMIFTKAKSSIDPYSSTMYSGIAQIIGTLFSLFFIDKFGRKFLIILSTSSVGVCMMFFSAYFFVLDTESAWFQWVPLAIVFCIVLAHCLGCRSVPSLLTTELFNTSVRSRASGVVMVYNRIINLIVMQVYPYLEDGVGNSIVFLICSIACTLSAIGCYIIVPETKGKSLEEVQEFFERKATLKESKRIESKKNEVIINEILISEKKKSIHQIASESNKNVFLKEVKVLSL